MRDEVGVEGALGTEVGAALWLPESRVGLSPTRAGHIPCPHGASSAHSPHHQLLGGCSGFPALSCPLQLPGTTGWRDGTWLGTTSIQPPSARGGFQLSKAANMALD